MSVSNTLNLKKCVKTTAYLHNEETNLCFKAVANPVMNSCVPLPVARLVTHAWPNRSPSPLRNLVKAAPSKSFSSVFTGVEQTRSALLSNKKVSESKSDWTASGRAALFSVPNRSGRDKTQSFMFASCTLQLNFNPWKPS